MKNLAFLLLLATGVCSAQGTPANESMASFWTRFQAAVVKGDAEAIASMTQLPFMLDNRNLDKAKFVKAVPQIFSTKMKTCIAKAKPVKDKDGFEIFCGEQMYVFEQKGGKFLFVTLGAND